MSTPIETDHKLCGFLCVVLSVELPGLPHSLSLGSSCYITNDSFHSCFRSDNGLILSLIEPSPISKRRVSSVNRSYHTERKLDKIRNIGMVNGSISVVEQLHTLVVNNCIKTVSRVVKASKNDKGEERAVVLVDIYLPVALWSGWQIIPKRKLIAALMFKHMSCDWKLRNSILNGESICGEEESLWNLSDCHVFDCKLNCKSPDSPVERLFKLHEIFKSLPSPGNTLVFDSSRVLPSSSNDFCTSGIWDLSNDVLITILMKLSQRELVNIAKVCRLLRSLACLIVPCMNLKLFPHQQSAVTWMLERERKTEAILHPLYLTFDTEDGFNFYVNVVTGEIIAESAPMVKDFRGGMFCDEPGLGKTITALSLILKTQGTIADPPEGFPVVWSDKNCGYYEYTNDEQSSSNGMSTLKRFLSPSKCRSQFSPEVFSPLLESNSLLAKKPRLMDLEAQRSLQIRDRSQSTSQLQGFYTKGESGERSENIIFFTNVLRQHAPSVNLNIKKALNWLANLPVEKISLMETFGLPSPLLGSNWNLSFKKIFYGFGLTSRIERGVTKWYYPMNTLDNLVFDSPALKVALCQPLNALRLYLSKATLIVVPANLVNHWDTQIHKHVTHGQLRILLWTDNKKIPPHSLAWDYDVVITTFSRLSAEWNPRKKSPMIQVHWLRVMLDEGHTLGSSLSLTNKFQMAVSLTASSRWLLTGTPTPNTPNSQLSHLQSLLKFLHDEVYGENLKLWEASILKPFEAEVEEGRSRLLDLLQRCMISSRKKDLRMIPPCIKKLTYINFVPEHARSYNELVETVRRNILLADWNDPSHVESLLNSKQWKFRSTTIRNVRLSCCVAGHIKMKDAGQDIMETMDALHESGLERWSDEYASIEDSLIGGCNCNKCGEWCRLPVITPCRHLLCLDCVALDSEKCVYPGCGYLYEMQTPETLARPENPNPKWPVPKDLIELQPSYNQDDWNPDWQSTSSSKVSYLVERLKKLHEDNKKTVGSEMVLVDKVLIFSQFLEHIHVIEQQLTISGIKFAGMYSPMHSANKMKSLAKFQNDGECMALLMDGSAALGLDLSFVTHVFLMEPIWDKSMEEQVISRAHRMGAKRPIYVETLAMNGTIEEQMIRFLEDAEKNDGLLSGDYMEMEQETTRSRRTLHDLAESNYLSHLSFVRSEGNT